MVVRDERELVDEHVVEGGGVVREEGDGVHHLVGPFGSDVACIILLGPLGVMHVTLIFNRGKIKTTHDLKTFELGKTITQHKVFNVKNIGCSYNHVSCLKELVIVFLLL